MTLLSGQTMTPLKLKTAHVALTRAANLSINNNTVTDVTWTVEESDVDGLFTAPGTTFTVPAGLDGVWDISAFAWFASNATSFRLMQLLINGAVLTEWRADAVSIGGQPTAMGLATSKLLAVGDTVKIAVYQLSGAALNLTGPPWPRFTLTRRPS